MTWGCRHDWKLLDKTELPSAWEQQAKANPHTIKSVPAWFFAKSVVLTLSCPKCGKLRIEQKVNPNP